MDDMIAAPVRAPVLNPLQRAWLREIGMEKVWLRQDTQPPDARGEQAGAGAVSEPRPESGVGTRPALPRTAQAGTAASRAQSAPGHLPGSRQMPASGHPSTSAHPSESGSQPASGERSISPERHVGGEGPAAAVAGPASGQTADANTPLVPPRPTKPSAPGARPGKDAVPATQPAPTAEALALLDLATLRERVVACEACGLCRGRRQAVFGMGPEQARWLVVGEAPGEQEDRQGLPFVGRSGQLLDAMLAAVGMSRERDVYIANVIKCRPPGNRNPKPEEIAACRPYLMRQIGLLKPERILVLGRFAAQTLLETDAAIGSLRGRVHALKTEDGEIPMVVSYHPAYLLRSPSEKARAWQDLQLAASL